MPASLPAPCRSSSASTTGTTTGSATRSVQHIVRDEHAGPHSIGIIDETSDVKKGDKTPGVQRQWCGPLGEKENCLVTVHLGYGRDDFHCLIDGELYLPESWSEDRLRCREAGIPDEMVYRPKWRIALELYDRAIGDGLHSDWMTFDEGYGSKPDFLRGLNARGQEFVGEVPRSSTGWLKPPRIITRPFHKNGRGRGRKVPRLASGSRPPRRVEELLDERAFTDQAWRRWRVKDGEKGPMIWEVKHATFTPKDEDGLPGEPMHLVVARNVLDPKEVKFFVSNAPRRHQSRSCCWWGSRDGESSVVSRARNRRSGWISTRGVVTGG